MSNVIHYHSSTPTSTTWEVDSVFLWWLLVGGDSAKSALFDFGRFLACLSELVYRKQEFLFNENRHHKKKRSSYLIKLLWLSIRFDRTKGASDVQCARLVHYPEERALSPRESYRSSRRSPLQRPEKGRRKKAVSIWLNSEAIARVNTPRLFTRFCYWGIPETCYNVPPPSWIDTFLM